MQLKCGFLIFNGFEDMDLIGPWQMFGSWKRFFNGPENIFMVSETGGMVKSVNELMVQPHCSIQQCPQLDVIIVPGGQGTRKEVDNPVLVSFIKEQAINCQYVISICTGAFLLCAAGLLANKRATTHWASIERLKQFSDITVVQERYIKDGKIWTSGGISSGIDLALAFIASVAGSDVAGKVQLYTEYYPFNKIYPQDQKLPAYVNGFTKHSKT